jgi:hypothetical protein
MKFTYTQKKWAMTGVLLAVLGFNVSMNKHTGGIASVDLASSSDDVAEGKYINDQGVHKVKFIQNGEHSVLAVVLNTEGSTCTTCGTWNLENTSLNKNKDNVDALVVQLAKQIKEAGPTEKPQQPVAKKAVREEQDEEIQYTDRVDKIEDQCASISDANRKAQCLTTKLSRLIPNKTDSENAKILNLINKKIIPVVGSKLTSLRSEAYDSNDFSTLRADSLDAIQPLNDLADAGKKDKNFTKAFMGLQANLLVSEFNKIKELEHTATSKAGTIEGQAAMNQALERKQKTSQLTAQLIDAQILPSLENLQQQYVESRDLEEKKMIKETMDRAESYTQLLQQGMWEITQRYVSNAQPAPTGTVSQGASTGVRGSGTRDGIQVNPGGTTALPAPSSIKSSGAPGPIAAPVQGVPNVGVTGYQLQTQSAQDALAPRVQLAPRGY